MRRYADSAVETLRARRLLTEWKADSLITEAQYEQLEQETESELRTTNFFLRLVLCFFTILGTVAAAALLFVMFRPTDAASSILLLVCAGLCCAAAEFAAAEWLFYHHGIEEGLALCSIGFFCAGLQSVLGFPHNGWSLMAVAGAISALWVWHRFELWYAFLISMLFVALLPADWTSSPSRTRLIVAILYAFGLVCLNISRPRDGSTALETSWSLAEALLWLGTYMALNLEVFPSDLSVAGFFGGRPDAVHYSRPFYWTTWLLVWCLPPTILTRGIRLKNRFLLGAGGIAALLTLASNKPYLGWPRHSWDPMILGILLTTAAVLLRRWLEQGPGGVRHAFSAARSSSKDTHRFAAGASVLGLVGAPSVTSASGASAPDLGLEGGASGGGGATRDF